MDALENFYPYCIYTIRHSRDLRADYKRGGEGEFDEKKTWTSALGFLDDARKTGKRLPILFAAGESIDGVIYFAVIEDLSVSESEEDRGTKVRFSGLQPVRPKRGLPELRLKSTGAPLSADYIRPYALCHTPGFLLTK